MFKGLFKLINLLAIAALLFSCMAVYINPAVFWQFSFIGFAFPVVLLVNVLFLFFWLFVWSRFALVPVIALALSAKFIASVIAFNSDGAESGIKLMSWNVKNFDLYTWSHNVETRSKMMALIEKENPDVLCLQEFYTNNQFSKNIEFLRDTLGFKYNYFPPSVEINKAPKSKTQKTLWKKGVLNQKWGVAIFSRYPLVDTGLVVFNGSLANRCIYSDVKIKGEKLRIYNVHFQSIQLGYEDYETIEGMQENKPNTLNAVKGIMRKMKRAYSRRSVQAKEVRKNMDAYKGRKMICGDFNDVPVSYAYQTVKNGLQDAFVEKGAGLGATYVHRFSFFRIDYVLFDSDTKINSYKTLREPLSDHYPVVTTFNL